MWPESSLGPVAWKLRLNTKPGPTAAHHRAIAGIPQVETIKAVASAVDSQVEAPDIVAVLVFPSPKDVTIYLSQPKHVFIWLEIPGPDAHHKFSREAKVVVLDLLDLFEVYLAAAFELIPLGYRTPNEVLEFESR